MTSLDQKPWPTHMPPAQDYCDEDHRLRVLSNFGLDALRGDAELDRIARFAAHLCDTPSAAISLVEEERQVFLARQGISATETPRSTSFCAHTMLGSQILEVLDTTADERFSSFATVTGDEHVRYYVGVPLISSEGVPLGALCVNDIKARTSRLTELQSEGLLTLAEAVKRRIETHRATHRATAELKANADRLQFMLDSVPDIAWSATPDPRTAAPNAEIAYFNARFTEMTGRPARVDIEDLREVVHPDDVETSFAKFAHAMEIAAFFEDEWRLRMKDGSYRWVISRAVPSTDDPATALWFGTLTDIDERYRISQERELLAGELAHRIKNIFAVINGLISLNARGNEQVQDFADALKNTIYALSRAQDMALRINAAQGGDLLELLTVLTEPYGIRGVDCVHIAGDKVTFSPEIATPLALVFHELATNSAKYGALSASQGNLTITVEQHGATVKISWDEKGGPAVTAPEDIGFGSRLIDLALGNQLGGSITKDWRKDGLKADITLSVESLAQ